jgi:hypothetical protein
MNHLEKLIRQYYEWRGYLVRGNVKVGKLAHGGWAGELDVVAYHPSNRHLVQIEPSLDAHRWEKRETRFKKKFELGKKYICKEVFPWLKANTPIEQIAILNTASKREIGGGRVISVDEMMRKIKEEVSEQGIMAKNAIPEEYDLLRSIQMVICGYYKLV